MNEVATLRTVTHAVAIKICKWPRALLPGCDPAPGLLHYLDESYVVLQRRKLAYGSCRQPIQCRLDCGFGSAFAVRRDPSDASRGQPNSRIRQRPPSRKTQSYEINSRSSPRAALLNLASTTPSV